jgi:hypothetical protein
MKEPRCPKEERDSGKMLQARWHEGLPVVTKGFAAMSNPRAKVSWSSIVAVNAVI